MLSLRNLYQVRQFGSSNRIFQASTFRILPSSAETIRVRAQHSLQGHSDKSKIISTPLWNATQRYRINSSSLVHLLSNQKIINNVLYLLDPRLRKNYLSAHFTYWLSRYSTFSAGSVERYFQGEFTLTDICNDFIRFCFKQGISLDNNKTLNSFTEHNQLSDNAVKNELLKIMPKKHINLLGFGLDEGFYEKSLAQFLLKKGIAKTVKIYGFDPYALRSADIEYLTSSQLNRNDSAMFDLVTSRWALHHVEHQQRWADLITCITHCNPGATVLAVEHGFLNEGYSILDKRLYYLLNATFDIIANIGLRPRYFTDSAPNIGVNFCIQYLTQEDFSIFRKSIPFPTSETTYEIGPAFPNQTIYCLRIVN